jgi:thiosulfate/3-mercaptopyruvate sulfurtransferase
MNDEKTIIFDATLLKVKPKEDITFKGCIPKTLEFDLIKSFKAQDAKFPNTCLSQKKLTHKLKNLGINKDSIIVIYDRHGIYSSPRTWWLLKQLGHKTVYVLNGGLPAWIEYGGEIEKSYGMAKSVGSFEPSQSDTVLQTKENLFKQIKNTHQLTIDARSNKRFLGLEPEPREGLRAGHIPNSKNIHYSSLIKDNKLISKPEIKALFNKLNYTNKTITYTCGSGITACILALAGSEIGINQFSVYDGSWTEWGSLTELPIER